MKLREDELLERARKAASLYSELLQHQLASSVQKKQLKEREDELTREHGKLEHVVHAGEELREVGVEAWADFRSNKLETVRVDTYEVIHTRTLSPEERQGEFDLEQWRFDFAARARKEAEDASRRRTGDKPEADEEEDANDDN